MTRNLSEGYAAQRVARRKAEQAVIDAAAEGRISAEDCDELLSAKHDPNETMRWLALRSK